MSIAAIVNPKAGGGKSAQVWARARLQLTGSVETFETEAPGHAIELTAQAIKRGARTIVAVGGDGTINEVVNGFFEDEHLISPETTLGIIPYGTGSDFCRILDLPLDEKKAAAVIHSGSPHMVDLVKVRYTRMDGTNALRYSINVTSFGMGGAVAARANRSSKAFGGKISFLLATLETALSFSGNSVRLRLDQSTMIESKITNVVIGNGQYHGAGMWVCPGASIDDGLLEVTMIRYLSLIEFIKGLPALYNGAIYQHPKVQTHRVKRLEADSKEPVLIEVDGEPLGRLPIEVCVLPRVMRVLIP